MCTVPGKIVVELRKMTETNSGLPIQLYHYTSIHGVEGIITKKVVWASLLHFMNDSKEWLYALELVKRSLGRKVSFRTDKLWLAYVAALQESLNRIEGLNICAFSLTAMPNQLSQWRAYCPPEGGYNLSFDSSLLKQHLNRQGFQLRQCIYDLDVEERAINEVVTEILDTVGELKDESGIDKAQEIALTDFTRELAVLAPILKHPDFREEQEWRAFSLVYSNDSRMEYHVKGTVAVPHCVLDLQTDTVPFPISQVTVGPNAHQDLAHRGLYSLANHGNVRFNVSKSTTPLRNL